MNNRQLCAFDMRVDDLDDQGRPFLYLLQEGQMRRQLPTKRRAAALLVCVLRSLLNRSSRSSRSSLRFSRSDFLQTSRSSNFRRWPARSFRRRLAQPCSGLPEVVPSRGKRALGRPFDGRSYACSVGVRMKGDFDDLRITSRGTEAALAPTGVNTVRC
jgi:hypothetical protein